MSLFAGPAEAATPSAPCAPPRTDAHHSEGVSDWNEDYVRPVGRLNAVMVFLSFPDAQPSLSPRRLLRDHFPATSDFFSRASYGRFDLRVHPVRHWLRMPNDSVEYGIRRDWDPQSRALYLSDALEAADPSVDFSRYDVVYLVADPDAPGVDSDATKVVNFDQPVAVDGTRLRRVVTVFEEHPPDLNVLAHETGHIFDLPDLYHQPERADGDWDRHVGDWDLMGSQFGMAPDPFGWHKWKLGWLDRDQVDCVPQDSGSSLHLLRPLAEPREADRLTGPRPRPVRDTRLVVVRTGPERALALEARERRGNDETLCRPGVLVYEVRADIASAQGPVKVVDGHPGRGACGRESVYPPLADAPLRSGESRVLEDQGVEVRVGDRLDSGGWAVRVVREPNPGR
ncbi:M6 family metalloprotease domain-containing protein [Streptomyces sp. NPDC005438]|uniref:M6 family metalloprotease domain-containing protein n=1 Tax=Streptomyces sp. NPDC005438 TaxID=3156880 RepID=UPI0033BA48F6